MNRRHLSYRSSNPTLNSNTFKSSNSGSSILIDQTMTIRGTVDKTAISLVLLIIAAYYTYSNEMQSMIWIGSIGGFILALVTIFKKEWSPYTVPVYAVLEGLALGAISKIYDTIYEGQGIVFMAISLTVLVLFSLLFAYKTKIIKATENFKLGIFAATAGIAIFYIIGFVLSLFDVNLSFLNPQDSGLFSIGVSFFIVIIAGGTLMGTLGMIVAIPLYTALKVVFKAFMSENKIVKSLTQDI